MRGTARWITGAAVTLAGMGGTSAQGQCVPRVLYTNFSGLPSSVVPGTSPIARFAPGASASIAFQQIAVSPSGNFWALRGSAGTSSSWVIVRGVGGTRTGAQLVVRRSVTQVLGTRTCDSFSESIDVGDSGAVAFTGDLSGTTNDDAFSATWNGGFTFLAREGQPVPGLLFGFGALNASAGLLADGRVRHISASLTGSSGLTALVSMTSATSGEVLALTGTTQPAGQLVQPAQPLAIVLRAAWSADGADALLEGTLAGPQATSGVLVHGDRVVAQQGFGVAGTGTFANVLIGPAPLQCAPTGGRCLARIALADGRSAILRMEGGVVTGMAAVTGEATAPGSGEVFSSAGTPETFLACAINSAGDVVVVGGTDATNPLSNAVMIFNGTQTLLREGSELDLNEDGVLNDNAFVGSFFRDGVAISDNGDIYALVTVRGAAGNVTGNAVVMLRAPVCSDLDFNNDQVFPSDQDTIDFFSVLAGENCPACDSIDFNNDCVFPSDEDVAAFFRVLAGGSCTP